MKAGYKITYLKQKFIDKFSVIEVANNKVPSRISHYIWSSIEVGKRMSNTDTVGYWKIKKLKQLN